MKLKLKGKILALALIPLILLGISMFLVAADRIANGIYDEAYIGMQGTTLAVRDIFEIGYDGPYIMDENGELWKGKELNISKAFDIVDHIKQNTGMDVTIFWNDTRVLTSITDKNGNRQVGTTASSAIVQQVLKEGKPYQNRNVDILGTKYVVYYAPFFQEESTEAVGMIFLGTPQHTVSKIINKARSQLLILILVGMILATIAVYGSVHIITKALKQNMQYLYDMAQGNLNISINNRLLKRSDEIGDLGQTIVHLKSELKSMITAIRTQSKEVYNESEFLYQTTETVCHVTEEINHSVQEIADSCSRQSEDASHAGSNVMTMGELIEENGIEIGKLHEISGSMHEVTLEAMQQFEVMNHVMHHVHESIHFLSEQTRLTSDSVSKISSATEIITSIASQTNLLSLNASIEAARAGEHGKGFAVVAAEIQQLSEQSDTAAKEIKEIVDTLNLHSMQTLERVEETKNMLQTQTENFLTTSQSFRQVQTGVLETVEGIKRIAQKSEMLDGVRSNTISIVQNSSAISEENSASVEEIMAEIETIYTNIANISEKTRHLHELSQEMQQKVELFSIN